ncbi:MAG: hypothetical protein JST80_09965 [Bdellovibrionales bacterium]|nr:hypothetical protein [Bdellovibrionales bacterium]
MMKKTLLAVALIGSTGLLSSCSETPYTPAPQGQQTYYPTNNVNQIPGQILGQIPGQPIPAQQTMLNNQPVFNPACQQNTAQYQYQLSAYSYLMQNRQNCASVVSSSCITNNTCVRAKVKSSCTTWVRAKRGKVIKSCNSKCEEIILVAVESTNCAAANNTTSTTRREDNNGVVGSSSNNNAVVDDGSGAAGYLKPTTSVPVPTTNNAADNNTANNNNAANNNNNSVDNNAANNNTTNNNNAVTLKPIDERDPIAIVERKSGQDYHEFVISGNDARVLYERLAISKDKKNDNIRRGPNIECNKELTLIGLKKDYGCIVAVFTTNDKDIFGKMPVNQNQGVVATAESTSTDPYPASNYTKVQNLRIKTKGDTEARLFIASTDASKYDTENTDAWSAKNLYLTLIKLNGAPIKQQLDEGLGEEANTKIDALVVTGGNLKCYRTLTARPNGIHCMIKMDYQKGEAKIASGNAEN